MNKACAGPVLVTGATGFVGAHVARRLVTAGFTVRALCRGGSSRRLLGDLPVEWRIGDLRDPGSLRAAVNGCSALFHVAADYRLFAARPQDLYETNVAGTRSLLEAARDAGVPRTVYTSTVGALGLPEGGGSGDEDTPAALESMVGDYKRSKFLAEKAAMEAVANGMNVVIVNPSTPVGEGDVKPTPTGRLIVDFLNGRMPAYLDTGLNLIAVKDVAEGHLLAFMKGQPGRRYILGHRNLTLHQVLRMLAEMTGLPAPEIRIPYSLAYSAALISTGLARVTRREPPIALEAVRLAHSHMFFDSSLAVADLGLPQTDVSAALREAVQWFLTQGYVKNKGRCAALLRAAREQLVSG
ncbi:MAG: NAD-dependent epimerase/dehydratase family protein [Chloroflexi bacterium]|nr:NAD-dependent epimerase/dehydratase family protein [Chloroflexota bacterium]